MKANNTLTIFVTPLKGEEIHIEKACTLKQAVTLAKKEARKLINNGGMWVTINIQTRVSYGIETLAHIEAEKQGRRVAFSDEQPAETYAVCWGDEYKEENDESNAIATTSSESDAKEIAESESETNNCTMSVVRKSDRKVIAIYNTPSTMNANENTISDFETYCKDYIKDNINDCVGNNYYMCELGIEMTQGPNCDGTLTYSRTKAKDYIREWWDEAAEYWDYEKLNFGENSHNPFDNPEAYMVCMVIEGVQSLLSQCTEVNEQWNEEVELTQDLADSICEQIDDFNIEW